MRRPKSRHLHCLSQTYNLANCQKKDSLQPEPFWIRGNISTYRKIIPTCSTLYFSDWVVLDRLFFCLFSRFRNDSPRFDPMSSWVILFFPLLTWGGKTTKSSWWLKHWTTLKNMIVKLEKIIWNHHPVESLCSQCVIDKMRPFLLFNFHTTCKCWYMCDLKAPPLTHSCLARHTFYSKIPQGSTKNTKIIL